MEKEKYIFLYPMLISVIFTIIFLLIFTARLCCISVFNSTSHFHNSTNNCTFIRFTEITKDACTSSIHTNGQNCVLYSRGRSSWLICFLEACLLFQDIILFSFSLWAIHFQSLEFSPPNTRRKSGLIIFSHFKSSLQAILICLLVLTKQNNNNNNNNNKIYIYIYIYFCAFLPYSTTYLMSICIDIRNLINSHQSY